MDTEDFAWLLIAGSVSALILAFAYQVLTA
jgi:hypothetical protein